MQLSTNYNSNTAFGTKIGPKLMHKLETHPEWITQENRQVLKDIVNNGFDDTVLEFCHAPAKLHERFSYNYQLILKGGVVDKKNEIMHNSTGFVGDKADETYDMASKNSYFPINFKDFGADTMAYMLTFFAKNKNMNAKILDEIALSEKVVKESASR